MATSNIVVVGVDGSPESTLAIEWAAHEAVRRDATLRIVHVWRTPAYPTDPLLEMPPEESAIAATAQRIAQHANAAVRCEAITESGSPPRCVVGFSRDASLLVLGGHHRGLVDRVVFGSVAGGALTHATCPVVLVRGQHSLINPAIVTGPVVVGVDHGDSAYDALDFAAGHASTYGLGLVAVQAWEHPESQEHSAADLLWKKVRPHLDRYPRVDFVSVVANDSPTTVLLEWAAKASLLVVGSRGRNALTGLLLGSVSAAVANDAPCSVAVVKEKTVAQMLDDLAS